MNRSHIQFPLTPTQMDLQFIVISMVPGQHHVGVSNMGKGRRNVENKLSFAQWIYPWVYEKGIYCPLYNVCQ